MEIKQLLSHFAIDGDFVSAKQFGNGHINQTYLVTTTKDRYIFQFINHTVFPNVDMVMNNIYLVTNHLQQKGEPTLSMVPCHNGLTFYRVGEDFLRGYRYVGNSLTYEKLPNLEMVEEAARGFGRFHQALSDIDVSQIGDVIPFFHDTKKRFNDFLTIYKENKVDRIPSCREECEFILSRVNDYSILVDALKDGSIHPAITHNDPKINNIAFDKTTNKVSCVLDLDTVMKGTFLYDFGDALRSLFTGDNEDSEDTSLLKADLDIYEAYLRGYYSMMKDVINEKEKELLPYAVLVITEELAMRFLGDYLAGDVYFGAKYQTHNLVRARTQIALAQDILARMDELQAITKKICQ